MAQEAERQREEELARARKVKEEVERQKEEARKKKARAEVRHVLCGRSRRLAVVTIVSSLSFDCNRPVMSQLCGQLLAAERRRLEHEARIKAEEEARAATEEKVGSFGGWPFV